MMTSKNVVLGGRFNLEAWVMIMISRVCLVYISHFCPLNGLDMMRQNADIGQHSQDQRNCIAGVVLHGFGCSGIHFSIVKHNHFTFHISLKKVMV